MEDVTKRFLEQSKEYGRKPHENITRIGMYSNKVFNIYKTLGKEKMDIKIFQKREVTGFKPGATKEEASDLIKELGAQYFVEIFYTNDWNTLKYVLNGEIPQKEKREERESVSAVAIPETIR